MENRCEEEITALSGRRVTENNEEEECERTEGDIMYNAYNRVVQSCQDVQRREE